MTERQHPYPSQYGKGTHWASDRAWEILDTLPVGLLSNEHRFLLGGMIAGALLRAAGDHGAPKGFVLVPEAALAWLNGAAPDAQGRWFDPEKFGARGPYWWRSVFRAMIAAEPKV